MAALALLLLIATGIGVVYVALTLGVTRDIGKKQVKGYASVTSGYLSIGVPLNHYGYCSVVLQIRNSGQSPVTKCFVEASLNYLLNALVLAGEARERGGYIEMELSGGFAGTIPVGGTESAKMGKLDPSSVNRILDNIGSGSEDDFLVAGKIIQKDVFGDWEEESFQLRSKDITVESDFAVAGSKRISAELIIESRGHRKEYHGKFKDHEDSSP